MAESLSTTVFPHHTVPLNRQVIDRLGIAEVKFNAVAPTAIAKALKRVAAAERRDVPQSVVDKIVEVSGGDLRCALNSLQVESGSTVFVFHLVFLLLFSLSSSIPHDTPSILDSLSRGSRETARARWKAKTQTKHCQEVEWCCRCSKCRRRQSLAARWRWYTVRVCRCVDV
jgi:DNA polymerase III delta prime subunit